MPELGIIALTPAAWTGNDFYPGIAIAAARAGAVGVLDLEYLERWQQAGQALDLLIEESAAGGIGIRCGIEQVEEFQALISKVSASDAAGKWMLLAVREKDYDKKTLSSCLASIRKKNVTVVVEAIDLAEAKLAEHAGADAVIAKGHESSGRVGAETSFVLLQRFRRELSIPVWARGGIGVNSGAAALAAGCAGVVLDSQLLLTRESPLTIEQKEKISNFDGTETELFGLGHEYLRVWARAGAELPKAIALSAETVESANQTRDLRRRLRHLLTEAAATTKSQLPAYCALGQDIAFALPLSRRYVSVGAVLSAIKTQASDNLRLCASQETLAQNSPFAVSHGTMFPVVQGAMTRVSDNSEFALKVAEAGGLPFLALALMRQDELEPLLEQSQQKLAGLAWGVGMLGFVPPELRQEQLKLVLKYRPSCALIAGGRPDQAKELETAGIKTYLHVPSPALLESFVEMGTRRFIFEGKECGGHVGPRSSFVLWESMIETLLRSMPAKSDPAEFHVVFAGGIHDKVSAAMVAAMAVPLVERGVRVGILMGTAYLFTKEAVTSGAIVSKFQEAALHCQETVLLETGPGHAIRCLNSPYKQVFDEKRRKMESEGYGKNELREELELMNLGRLRVASKGLARGDSNSSTGSKLVKVSADKQWSDGMYMIGQVAVMHDKTLSIRDLHESVSNSADSYLKSLMPKHIHVKETPEKTTEEPIAIVGMSCLFPKANDLESFWQNILNKVDCIEEIPLEQWDASLLYSDDPLARDKIYSKWGGFLREIPFDPSVYGIPPSSLASIDPIQLLILEVTRAALHDAGYQSRPFPKERTSIVLANAGHGPITAFYSLRSMLDWTLADLDPQYRKELEKRLPEWTEDSFPGYLGNVVAGRVANRFDLGGINFCVDAACASSLAALYTGIRELRAGSSDMVLLAATDAHNQPGDYLSFSKTHALSPRGRCRTFDATADGIAISEGMAVIVLKRLADAERDGDRIYALVKGIGGSSDGRDLSLTAPRPAGQMLALTRAYEDAGVSPSTVELVEAHGTGTVAGDRAEVEALRNVFEKSGAEKQVCAIGSVKTMIGHTKCAAGLASIIKIARSLYHKVLPPTIGVDTPNPACNFETSPFYVNTEARPWVHDSERLGYPRRAGVSAFGFGGTNFHTVLEEYKGQRSPRQESAIRDFPTEIFSFHAASRAQLARNIEALENSCKKLIEFSKQPHGPMPPLQPCSLFELAYRHHLAQNSQPPLHGAEGERHLSLAIVAGSAEDLLKKLEQLTAFLADESKISLRDPKGVFFADRDGKNPGLVAFLFPGQGSQQVNMLADLCLGFADIRRTFERSDSALAGKFEQKLSRYVFPTPAFTADERRLQAEQLTDTHIAQPAVAAADMAAFALFSGFGLKPDICAGHSFGEYVALAAAGVMSEAELFKISEQRGAILKSANDKKSGSMTAVSANGEEVRRLIAHLSNVTLANINSPRQCIISGENSALAQASKVLAENKVKSRPIAVSAAFHSPLMEPAVKQLSRALSEVHIQKAQIPVYSNTLAKPYPHKPEQIASLLCEHLVKPVEFQQQIEQMYESGARIFIECGPGAILSALVDDILEGKEHQSLSLERHGKNGVTQLQHVLAQAFVAGVELDFGNLYRHRVESLLPRPEISERSKAKLTYLINGSHIKRYDGKIAVPSSRPTEQAMRIASGQMQTPETGPSISPDKKAMEKTVSASEPASGQKPKPAFPTGKQPLLQPNLLPDPARRAQAPQSLPGLPGGQAKARDQVMLEFQRSMTQMTSNFLQTQERVMLAYLQRSGLPEGSAEISGQAPDAQVRLAGAGLRLPEQIQPEQMQPAYFNNAESETAAAAMESDAAALRSAGFESLPATESGAMRGPAVQESNLPDRLNADVLVAQLIQIVSERTGYPAEMLDPSLDLEADLGIDSIKRVEILNNFRKLLPEEVQTQLESGIEKLAGTKTLQGIIDWIESDLASTKAAPGQSASNELLVEEKNKAAVAGNFVGRAVVSLKELPLLSMVKPQLSGLYLITDSEDGLAEALAAKLVAAGAETIILRHRDSEDPAKFDLPAHRLVLDLCREDLVRAFARKISESYENVSGLIHLLPLQAKLQASPPAGDRSGFSMIRSLLLLSRELLVPLSQSGQAVKLIAASSMGGSFGNSEDSVFNPLQGSIPGLLKTYAREYPQSAVRALDFSQGLLLPNRADLILAELGHLNSELVEVGYPGEARVTLEALPQSLDLEKASDLELGSSSVILVTGGARGITAELCLELGQRHKPNFVIVGRGVRPADPEDQDYKGLTSPKEIKAAIMEKLRRAGSALSVPAVESVYQRLIKEREIRNNLARIEATGAHVHYHSLDVRDHAAFTELIDRLYDSFGKIDAVIHGAGVIEDAFIKDKSLASFDRVFGTKVESALTLASRLQLDKLKYLILFSSVVGRAGNAGQCDYVAANEVLNKLALKLNKESNARVLSIGWGPWRGGMAQTELESVFARYGWSMIEAADGRSAFYNELRAGLKNNAEVLLVGQVQSARGDAPVSPAHLSAAAAASAEPGIAAAGSPANSRKHSGELSTLGAVKTKKNGDSGGNGHGGNGSESHGAELVRARGSRLNRAEVLNQDLQKLQLRLRLDPEFDLYLKDHTFDGMPVLPMAVATELLAETAQFMYPDLRLAQLVNLDIPSGIMFENGARDLYLNLNQVSSTGDELTCELSLCTNINATRKNFVARAVLREKSAEFLPDYSKFSAKYKQVLFLDAEAVPPNATDVYTEWLFHGPLFQGINSIDAMGRNGIEGELHAVPMAECLKECTNEPWLVDPILLDSAMQLAGVWARHYMGVTALPTGFKALHLLARLEGNKFRAVVQVPEESKNGQLCCDLAVYDEAGNLVILMEGLGGVGSKALNRLGATPKSLRGK